MTPITLSDWDEVLIVVALSLWLGEKEIEFLEQNWAWKRFDFELNFGFHESTSVDEAQGMLLNTCWYLPCFENAIWLNIAWWVVVARWYPAKELKINYDFIFFKSVFGTNELWDQRTIYCGHSGEICLFISFAGDDRQFFLSYLWTLKSFTKRYLSFTPPTLPHLKKHTLTRTQNVSFYFFVFCPFFLIFFFSKRKTFKIFL